MADSEQRPKADGKKSPSWTITPLEPEDKGIGADLRKAREARGLSIDDVAAVLKIRRNNLAALEDGRSDDLPGLAYAVGFVRTYAEYLDLDGLDAVRRYKAAMGPEQDADKELVFPLPIREQRFPAGLLIVGVVAIAAASYGGWTLLKDELDPTAQMTAGTTPQTAAKAMSEEAETDGAMPSDEAADVAEGSRGASAADSEMPPATEPVAERGAETVAASPDVPAPGPETGLADSGPVDSGPAISEEAEDATTAAAEDSAATERDTEQVIEQAAEVPMTAPLPPAVEEVDVSPPATPVEASAATNRDTAGTNTANPEATGQEAALRDSAEPEEAALPSTGPSTGPAIARAAPGPSRVELRASADAWVQIRDASNRIVFARVLHEGESYAVPGDPGLNMVTGNAGALLIYVDGQLVDPLGPMGAVRRDVALDPDRLLGR